MGPMRQSWNVPRGTRLVWKSYGDEFVVYNCASGHTHYLNLLAAIALEHLQERPATIEELAERIRGDIEVEGKIEGLAQLPDLVAQFDELGLIAPLAP